jgi:hypothetical protein
MTAGGPEILRGKKIIEMLGHPGGNGDGDLSPRTQDSGELSHPFAVVVHVLDDFGADNLVEGPVAKGKAKGVPAEEQESSPGFVALLHLAQNVLGLQKTLVAEVHPQDVAIVPETGKGMAAFAAARV